MEEIILDNHRAIIELPEEAVEINLEAKVYHDGELITVFRKINQKEIREMFRKADDGYIDDDDTFVMTDKGRAYLEELENRNRGSVMFGSEN